MSETTSGPGAQARESCFCHGAGPKVTENFRMKSEAARQHFRNARIEFLKAIRTLVDERIAHLSRDQQKGSTVNVE
jgi:hypothetical protein